jgi:hypothetical protein
MGMREYQSGSFGGGLIFLLRCKPEQLIDFSHCPVRGMARVEEEAVGKIPADVFLFFGVLKAVRDNGGQVLHVLYELSGRLAPVGQIAGFKTALLLNALVV